MICWIGGEQYRLTIPAYPLWSNLLSDSQNGLFHRPKEWVDYPFLVHGEDGHILQLDLVKQCCQPVTSKELPVSISEYAFFDVRFALQPLDRAGYPLSLKAENPDYSISFGGSITGGHPETGDVRWFRRDCPPQVGDTGSGSPAVWMWLHGQLLLASRLGMFDLFWVSQNLLGERVWDSAM